MVATRRAEDRPVVVVALGGNALLQRDEAMTAENQRRNIRRAAQAIAPLTRHHRVVVAHGNGPQVGLLSLEAEAYKPVEPFPLDVLNAETAGMIGYMLEQELVNALPAGTPIATMLTMIEVDPRDPAFVEPTKFVGPLYAKEEADRLGAEKGWTFKLDGDRWRRVVASPRPLRILELKPVRWLLQRNTVVICAGGGGIPTVVDSVQDRRLVGIEAVIDKDLASELLAEAINADVFVMATDVDAVYRGWGTAQQEKLGWVTPSQLTGHSFPAGSMGPKIEAAVRFVTATGRRAAIGSLDEIQALVRGEAGTNITVAPERAHAPLPTA